MREQQCRPAGGQHAAVNLGDLAIQADGMRDPLQLAAFLQRRQEGAQGFMGHDGSPLSVAPATGVHSVFMRAEPSLQ